jgi:PAS domain-containing protein
MVMEQPEKKFESKSAVSEHPAAEELHLSEKRFRTVFEAAPLGIAIADSKGYILEANHVFFRLLGYDQNEIKKLNQNEIKKLNIYGHHAPG